MPEDRPLVLCVVLGDPEVEFQVEIHGLLEVLHVQARVVATEVKSFHV